jgi:hypothetical protein
MLKAIHASEDIVAAREKAVRVIDKLRGLRLTKAAELAEAGVEEALTTTASRRSTGGESAPTIRSSASCGDPTSHPRRGALPDGQSAFNLAATRLRHHRWHRVVEQEISEHRADRRERSTSLCGRSREATERSQEPAALKRPCTRCLEPVGSAGFRSQTQPIPKPSRTPCGHTGR